MAHKPGYFGEYGGAYVPETLVAPLADVAAAFERCQQDASFQAAKATAGQRRLAAAKAGVASRKGLPSEMSPATVTLDEARRYLAQAANDSRYTLAARGLGELSDEEVLRLYNQIKSLEPTDGGRSST